MWDSAILVDDARVVHELLHGELLAMESLVAAAIALEVSLATLGVGDKLKVVALALAVVMVVSMVSVAMVSIVWWERCLPLTYVCIVG